MKRLACAGVAVALMGLSSPVGAAERGTVLVPVPGVGRVQRCASTTPELSPVSQGAVGHTLEQITPGAAFTLKADLGSELNDFDITFYKSFTPCAEGAVVSEVPHENVDGDEYGIVPADATTGVVTMHRGAPGVSFLYEETPVALGPAPDNDIVVAVIDTGLRSTHEEFDYCACGTTEDPSVDPDPTDQIVAWWDFSRENPGGTRLATSEINLPEHGQLWDDRIAHPYDGHGHGTATASLAVGGNAHPIKDMSFAPNVKLAVAKVGEASGTVSGNTTAALKWAVETVGADVVSMSIGAVAPFPEVLLDFHEQARLAREAGVLVVVSNGNGFGNASLVPGDTAMLKPFGNSTHVLSVGATGHADPVGSPQGGYNATGDPEVTAKYTSVSAAAITCDDCYAPISGTSFSAPLVAGMAARLKAEALDAGEPGEPDAIESLLKFSARDTQAPPKDEGYGKLGYHEMVPAIIHARTGTLPVPDPDNQLYVETVRNGVADVWTNKLDSGTRFLSPTEAEVTTGPGSIGTSLPTGFGEAELYTFEAAKGQLIRIDFEYSDATVFVEDELANDIDLHLFSGEGPSLSGKDAVVRSTHGYPSADGPDESVTFVAHRTGTFTLAVLGWFVVGAQPFELTSDQVGLTMTSQALYAHSYVI